MSNLSTGLPRKRKSPEQAATSPPPPPPLLNQRINSFAAEDADCPDLIFAPTDRTNEAGHCFEQQCEGVHAWTDGRADGKGTVVVGGGGGEAMESITGVYAFTW